MKLRKFLAFSLIAILSISTALADLNAIVNTSALVMREKASKSSKSILAIPEGESVQIVSVHDDWSKIIYGNQNGYVMNKYLKFDSVVYTDKSASLDNINENLQACKLGDSGSNIVLLQKALKALSLFNGNVDGDFGRATEKAVKKFQSKSNITADGIVGRGTIEALVKRINNQHSTDSRTSSSQINKYNKVKSIADINGVPKKVMPGDNSDDVAKLQQALNVLGYYNEEIDGNYGKSTIKAVKRFQKKRSLSADGIAGNGTISVLFNIPSNSTNIEKHNKDDNIENTEYESKSNLKNIYTIEDIGSTPRTSKPGDSGEDVVKLQQALALSSCYKGKIDGSYGESTQKAVKAFQKKRGMSADGIAGPSTIKHLFGTPAANANSYKSVLVGDNTNTGDSVNIIETLEDIGPTPSTSKPGDSGRDVIKLQQALSLLGYYSGKIDGKYSSNTELAVKKFQKKRGMSSDGIAGASTIRVMFGEPSQDSPKHEINNKSRQMIGIESIQDIGAVPNPSKPGFKGEDVQKLQQALSLLGYYDGNIDGNYGESTKNAVAKFQKKRGMNADGLAGASTLRILFGKSPRIKKADDTIKDNKKNNAAMEGISCIKDIGDIPKTSKPGNYSKDVKMLQQALTLLGYYDDAIDGRYGNTTKQAVVRFQKKKGMNADGIAGATTIRLIFGKSAKNSITQSESKHRYKTEILDWFSGGGNKAIPKKAVFEVKDCKTGLVFKAKRWSGGHHIDAEPLTANDTKIMKQIYGGFSWTRRSILVKYNGHVYACSMNNIPHGTQTIKNNGYEGHFCIHMLNSRTHGSDKIDHEHQNMLKKAYKYTW